MDRLRRYNPGARRRLSFASCKANMKPKYVSWGLLIALSVVGLSTASLSASEPSAMPGKAKAKMEAACLEIATLRSNIFLTLVQLDEVRRAENRQEQIKKFGLQLTNMVEQVKLTAERARAMKQRGDAYFAEWEARTAEIQDPELRRNAESRYAVRKRSYDGITQNLQEARANFEPLLADLRKIQELLQDNPDPAKGANYNIPQDEWVEGAFSGTHGSYWDKDGNLYVQDWNVAGRIMKLVRVK